MIYLIKIGTSTITGEDGELNNPLINDLVKQIVYLYQQKIKIILVTSGAVACGRRLLLNDKINKCKFNDKESKSDLLNLRTLAAIGQPYLLNIYNELFKKSGIISGQVLLQDTDFRDEARVTSIKSVINNLLDQGCIPILNENDATTIRHQHYRDDNGKILWDNDSLSTLVANAINVDRLILASNIDGVYDQNRQIITTWHDAYLDYLGNITTSDYGRGGILSKIKAASSAANCGIDTFIVNGQTPYILVNLNKKVGDAGFPISTYFKATKQKDQPNQTGLPRKNKNTNNHQMGMPTDKILPMIKTARQNANSKLKNMSHNDRCQWLVKFRDLILQKTPGILKANNEDLLEFQELDDTDSPLYKRLTINEKTINSLTLGISELIEMDDPIAKRVEVKQILNPFSENSVPLEWSRCQMPMGLIFVIFESRPDVLVQLLSLAIISGNGMILKGGKEARHSLIYLFSLFLEATPLPVLGAFNLLFTRDDAEIALSSPDISLVIPRGSNQFINWVSETSVAPVIGHGSGICCAYLDGGCDLLAKNNLELVAHSKLDYPAACNSLEILLIDASYFGKPELLKAISYWKALGIIALADGEINRQHPYLGLMTGSLPTSEYGDQRLFLAKVDGLENAIDFINRHGSGHTDLMITNQIDPDLNRNKQFLNGLNSSCAFINCSTRCADGYRMKMGCEVGINTQQHSWFRGPVGLEALMTTQIRLG